LTQEREQFGFSNRDDKMRLTAIDPLRQGNDMNRQLVFGTIKGEHWINLTTFPDALRVSIDDGKKLMFVDLTADKVTELIVRLRGHLGAINQESYGDRPIGGNGGSRD
jgi:hypothetical protein